MNNFQKIFYFKSLLQLPEEGIRKQMKQEIFDYFFDLENGSFQFLGELHSREEIENKLDLVIHKIIMHEHEDEIWNILEEYIN
jgi:hypothetical protein